MSCMHLVTNRRDATTIYVVVLNEVRKKIHYQAKKKHAYETFLPQSKLAIYNCQLSGLSIFAVKTVIFI